MPCALPFGRQKWVLGSDLSACAKDGGAEHNLTFSRCGRDEFTCKNGLCIPLKYAIPCCPKCNSPSISTLILCTKLVSYFRNRCDTKFNCPDQSDEIGCDYLKIATNYNKELAPPSRVSYTSETILGEQDHNDNSHLMIVYLNLSIQALPSIDTVNLKFTVDFFLQLEWYDSRLSFRNLNEEPQLNRLSSFDLNNIWVPELLFMNALGSLQTKVDDKAAAYISRNMRENYTTESYEENIEGIPMH